MGIALLMHAAFRGRPQLRAVVLVPWAILTVGTAPTWRYIVAPDSGFLNQILQALHLSQCAYRPWRCCPAGGLQMIPDEPEDAAKVDGARCASSTCRTCSPRAQDGAKGGCSSVPRGRPRR